MIRLLSIVSTIVILIASNVYAQSYRYGAAKKESTSVETSKKTVVYPTKSGDTSMFTRRSTAADTVRTNRIVNTYGEGDRYTITLDLIDNQDNMRISLYNLLGKKVLDIYSGDASSGRFTHTFNVSSVPKGMYLCVVRGDNFQLAEKFVITR